jgi:hypothetical protein
MTERQPVTYKGLTEVQRSGINLTTVGVISFRTISELCCFRNASESVTEACQVFYLYGDSKFYLLVFRGFTELDNGI